MQQLKLKVLELGKTRTKKASLDMFDYYAILAGHDKVKVAGRATTSQSKSRALPIQRKIQKMKVFSRIWVSFNNCLKYSDQKLKTFTFGIREQNKRINKPQLKMDLVTRKKLTKTF